MARSPDAHGRGLDSVWVVIPARNEEASLPLVLSNLPAVGRVVVADNGSTDQTARVAAELGATVVHEGRQGYGSACLAGLDEIRRATSCGETPPRVVVFLDADYSDHPEHLPDLAAPILDDQCDFVLGSRLQGNREPGAMPPQSAFGNRLACFLMRLIWGCRYTDLGPFRAIRYDRLRELRMEDRNFGWTIEMQIKAALAKLRIREIPVPYRRRIGVSKISGTVRGTILAGAKILYTIGRYAWKTRGRKPEVCSGPAHQNVATTSVGMISSGDSAGGICGWESRRWRGLAGRGTHGRGRTGVCGGPEAVFGRSGRSAGGAALRPLVVRHRGDHAVGGDVRGRGLAGHRAVRRVAGGLPQGLSGVAPRHPLA